MSFEKEIKVDKHHLDEEWEIQPSLVYKYSKQLVSAEKALNDLELDKDVLFAELDEKAREQEVSTEAKIKQWIIRQKEYQEVVKKRNNAKYEVGVLQGVVKAFEHKKKALERMVDLYLSNYWAEPKNQLKNELVSDGVFEKLQTSKRLLRRRNGQD